MTSITSTVRSVDGGLVSKFLNDNAKLLATRFWPENDDVGLELREQSKRDLLAPPFFALGIFDSSSNPTGLAILRQSQWDSTHFGLKVGRLDVFSFSGNRADDQLLLARHVRRKARANGFRVIISRIPLLDMATLQGLEATGWKITDVLVTLRYSISTRSRDAFTYRIDAAARADEDELRSIARNALKVDHFHNDARFDVERADLLYSEWISNCLHGLADVVLVARQGHQVEGFVTCKVKSTGRFSYGVIDLIAVRPELQGKRVGTTLLSACLDWFSSRVSAVYVGTQGGNQRALNLYQHSGFKVCYLEATLHSWLDE